MGLNILVVDDSLPMRAVIIKTIKASGHAGANFFEAANGQEALALLKDQWLDLVLTDYNMPVMNGMELIEAMKADEVLRTIPVLVVSTEGSLPVVDSFMARGAAGYIKKPFTPEEIRLKIVDLLGEVDDEAKFADGDNGLDF